MLGGYYNFSSDLLAVLAKINHCVWTDLFLIVYNSLMQGENTLAGEQGTHNQWVAFAQASFTMHKETLQQDPYNLINSLSANMQNRQLGLKDYQAKQ